MWEETEISKSPKIKLITQNSTLTFSTSETMHVLLSPNPRKIVGLYRFKIQFFISEEFYAYIIIIIIIRMELKNLTTSSFASQ